MKRIVLLITIVYVLFNFGNAFSQDEDISEALDTLQKRLSLNAKKLNDARVDLVPIDEFELSWEYLDAYFSINLKLSEAYQVHNYLIPIAMLNHYVTENNLKWCYEIIYAALLESKQDLNNGYNELFFPNLDDPHLFDVTEKIEKVMLNSISEIDFALKTLSKAIGSSH